MKKNKDYIIGIIGWSLFVLLIIFICICIFWTVYAFAKYGGQPINEIPAWALWFMFRR